MIDHRIMWREKQFKLLIDEIAAILFDMPAEPGFKALIQEALYKTGFRTTDNSDKSYPWPLLPLIVSEAVSGHYENALPVSASLLLLKCSAEVFDDTEDADSSVSLSKKYGSAVAMNVATTLLVLAEKESSALKKRRSDPGPLFVSWTRLIPFILPLALGNT